MQWSLGRLLVVEIDKVCVGGDDEEVGAKMGSEQRRCAVFVDHCLDADDVLAFARHRDAAPATSNDQHSALNQTADDFKFNNLDGLRRRDHAAIAAGGVFHDLPTQLTPAFRSLLARVERTDGLGRMLHRRVVERNDGAGDYADDRDLDASRTKFAFHSLPEDVADLALCRRPAYIERLCWNLTGSCFRTQESRAHLRTVTVGKHDAKPAADEADDLAGCAAGIRQLFGDRAFFAGSDQGVSADG